MRHLYLLPIMLNFALSAGFEVPEWDREVTGPLEGEQLPDYRWMH